MEKFSQWRDGATGIAPFFPYTEGLTLDSSGADTAVKVVSYLFGALTLPFTAAAFVLYALVFQHIPAIRRLFVRYVLLPSLHVWTWDVAHEGVKHKRVQQEKVFFKPGDVVVSNFTSPLDPIVYAAIFDPLFVVPAGLEQVAETSMFGAVKAALAIAPARVPGGVGLDKLIAAAKASGRVVVVFAEGSTSNGKGLLPFMPVDFAAVAPSSSLYPSAVKHSPPRITTPVPVSILSWLWSVVSAASVQPRVRFANKVESGSRPNATIASEVGDSICRVGRLRKLGEQLSASNKRSFVEAWLKGRR